MTKSAKHTEVYSETAAGVITPLDTRRLFPGVSEGIYMDVASRGLIPTVGRIAIEKALDARIRGTTDKAELFETIERVRGRYARLINAAPDEIAFTKNVSDGINAVASAIDWKPGDNVIVCPSLEHPTNIYPWINQKRRCGVEVRMIDDDRGHMPVEKMIAAISNRTRVVTASLVSFAPGFKTDIAKLGAACRHAGVLSVVDGAQGIGIVHLDMDRTPIDVLSVSTQKGLCAFYGLGFLYVRRAQAERLSPAYLSRFGVDIGDAHEAAADLENYSLMPAARRFEVGNYNYLGAIAVEPSLEILGKIGTETIQRHVSTLTHDMVQKLLNAGIPVYGGPPGPHLVHIVALGSRIKPDHDENDTEINALARILRNAGVRFSVRHGMIRLSLHLYNNQDDVDRLVDVAQRWNRGRTTDAAPES